MDLLIQEMKKIWRPITLVLIIILGILIYNQSMIGVYPYSHSWTEEGDYIKEWLMKYGKEMDEAEFVDAGKSLEVLYSEMDQWIQEIPFFTERKMTSYEDYEAWTQTQPKGKSDEEINGIQPLFSAETNYIGYRIQALRSMLRNYERDHQFQASLSSEIVQKRVVEVLETKGVYNIMSSEVIENVNHLFKGISVLVLISLCILLSPLQVKDKMLKIRELQYTSRVGRKIFKVQLLSTLVSAFILVSIELTILLGIYSTFGTQVFWECRMNSFISGIHYWFDFTYGTFLLINIGVVYLFSFIIAVSIFILANFSKNYITFLLKLLPTFLVLNQLGLKTFEYIFAFGNKIFQFFEIPGIEIILWVGLAALGWMACFFVWRYERRRECV